MTKGTSEHVRAPLFLKSLSAPCSFTTVMMLLPLWLGLIGLGPGNKGFDLNALHPHLPLKLKLPLLQVDDWKAFIRRKAAPHLHIR